MKGAHGCDGMKRPLVGLGLPIKFSAMTGHFRSAISRKPVDGRGNPIPWYSYPAIHFLSTINWEDSRVLEFGSGYSTLWWAARAGHVTTIEGDPEWFRVVQSKGGAFPNVRAIFRDDHLAHARAPVLLDETFDVVVVDGGDRYLCAESAAQVVASDGLIILDDAEGFWGQEGTYPIIDHLKAIADFQFVEHANKLVDLGVGVRCGHLDPEADVGAGDERIRGQGDVDPAREQEPPNVVDVVGIGQGNLDDRESRIVRRGDATLVERLEDPARLAGEIGPDGVPSSLVHLQTGQDRGERGNRRGSRVQVRRRGHLQEVLDRGRAGDEGQERRVRLGASGDQHDVVVALTGEPHDAVALAAVGAGLIRRPLTDDAEPVGIVDIERGVVLASQAGKLGEGSTVASHRVDAVGADHAGMRGGGPQQLLECLQV